MKKNGLLLFFYIMLLTGIIYPLAITFIANIAFPNEAKGSLIYHEDKIIGSQLIGQEFSSLKYFWPRPSATSYNTLPSNASNLGPTSEKLKSFVDIRKKYLMDIYNIKDASLIPSDLIFTSGSGLDPHISLEAANFQIDRIVKVRGFSQDQKRELITLINRSAKNHPKFLGPLTINVLELNLELDLLRALP